MKMLLILFHIEKMNFKIIMYFHKAIDCYYQKEKKKFNKNFLILNRCVWILLDNHQFMNLINNNILNIMLLMKFNHNNHQLVVLKNHNYLRNLK